MSCLGLSTCLTCDHHAGPCRGPSPQVGVLPRSQCPDQHPLRPRYRRSGKRPLEEPAPGAGGVEPWATAAPSVGRHDRPSVVGCLALTETDGPTPWGAGAELPEPSPLWRRHGRVVRIGPRPPSATWRPDGGNGAEWRSQATGAVGLRVRRLTVRMRRPGSWTWAWSPSGEAAGDRYGHKSRRPAARRRQPPGPARRHSAHEQPAPAAPCRWGVSWPLYPPFPGSASTGYATERPGQGPEERSS
jgi:hypothetical protein